MDSDVLEWIQQLADKKWQAREAAARTLGQMEDIQAVPHLIQALDDRYAAVRQAAVEALGRIGDERAVPHLIQALGDRKPSVSYEASKALSQIGGASVSHLVQALGDGRWKVREQAAAALGRIGDRDALPQLIQALNDRDSGVRSAVASALGRLDDRRAVPHLVQALEVRGNSSYWAAKALARLGAVSELSEALEDRRWRVRAAAVGGLSGLGEAAKPYLTRALDDPHEQVRERAAKALGKTPVHPPGSPGPIEPVEPVLLPFGPVASETAPEPQEQQRVAELCLRDPLQGDKATTLIYDLLESDVNVLLTPTWIAQAQKALSQEMLMEVERDTLWPMTGQLMADLLSVLNDDDARTWSGTAQALLNEEKGTGAVVQRVDAVLKDPAATPRGHYEEGMHGYFRGLQFLLKSVFDVRLDKDWCGPISHFVFPWSALDPILAALRTHPDLRQRWQDLHRFYTIATGEPDSVCIRHLLDLPDVTPETVSALSRELGVPKINRKMGIGVQGLAERFTCHGVIFEHLKETFLPDVSLGPIPRESVYAVVNMHSLLYGFQHYDGRLPMLLDGQATGLLEALAPLRQQPMSSFFDQFLMAQYELVADLPVPEVTALVPSLDPAVERLPRALRRRLNAFAANLTSLLELSILSAKQPMKVVLLGLGAPQQARIYVEEAPRPFFERLGHAAQTVTDLCKRMVRQYGTHPSKQETRARADSRTRLGTQERDDTPRDFATIYRILADLSEAGRFIPKASREWHTIAPLVERLRRNPNVTADAYRHVGPGGQYFLQWCTALVSFEAHMTDGTLAKGGELLFVEGWNDAIVPGRRQPLTNSVWRKALGKIRVADLKGWTIAPYSEP